jgi:1,4-dihydroxy-6-naphthoate synthase
MSPITAQEIVCAHSPDSDDAYMFYALATKKLRSPLVKMRHVLEDIQSLNEKALRGQYEMTAISYHAYPYLADKYVITTSGGSIGDGYGPVIIANDVLTPKDLKGKRIAVPGRMTTSYLAARLFEPDFVDVVVPFDQVLQTVANGTADAGLLIHEAQLTYSRQGLHKVIDLGAWWKQTQNLPLPLGANAILRDLPPDVKRECTRLLKDSIQYALDHPEEALTYAMQFARDLETSLAEKFVGMYVNHYTVDCGPLVPVAAQKMLDMGFERGIIPHKAKVEFVS